MGTARYLSILVLASTLAGCLVTSGTYSIVAVDDAGEDLTKGITHFAYGSGIYSSRSALCSIFKGATVIIRDTTTGEQLKGESPRRCRS